MTTSSYDETSGERVTADWGRWSGIGSGEAGGGLSPRVFLLSHSVAVIAKVRNELSWTGFQLRTFSSASELVEAHLDEGCQIALIDVDSEHVGEMAQYSDVMRSAGAITIALAGSNTLENRLCAMEQDVDLYMPEHLRLGALFMFIQILIRKLPKHHEHKHAGVIEKTVKAGKWRLIEEGWVLADPQDNQMRMTTIQRSLISCLFRMKGKTVSREIIICQLGADVLDFDPRRIDTIISRLRQRARDHGIHLPLHAVRGEGFVLAVK